MRRSGWLLPGAALGLWIAAVAWPALALAGVALAGPGRAVDAAHGPGELFARSAGWALAVALGAVAAGWAPGRLLGRALQRRWYGPVAALLLVPACLPAYVVFYAWWQAWPADSALFAWAARGGHLDLLKSATLLLGLLCWSWPLVAWCVAGFTAATPAQREELLRLDGAGPVTMLLDRLRCDGRGLALGGLIVFLFVFNNTTTFDVAGVFTFGYELRVIADLGGGPRDVVAAAAPALAVAALGTAARWALLGRGFAEVADRPARVTRATVIAVAVIWAASALVPMALFAASLGPGTSVGAFAELYGRDLWNTLAAAAGGGLAAALVTVGLTAAWQDQRRAVRRAADAQALGWIAAGVVPGLVLAAGLEAAYNRPGLDGLLYSSPAVLGLAYVGRFAFVGALLARWAAQQEPRGLADLRRLDGAGTLAGYARAAWPRLLAAGGAAFAVVAALSMSELAVTSRLQPRGFAVIAGAILNAVHYQRPDTALLGVLALMGAVFAAAALALAATVPLRRFATRMLCAGLATGVLAAAGCGAADAGPRPLEPRAVFGSPGRSLGQFQYPRGIAVDARRELVYVVDKSARVQRFAFDGTPQVQWRMPEWANGKPTGLGVGPAGNVWVADTHYHRVIVYDPDGNELRRFGGYGEGPGQFIYPTDVAFGPDGRVYVSEYGDNDRVSVYTAQGEFQFSFGGYGDAVGRFRRPQSMAFSADGSELYIADACNHRIVVTDPQGAVRRVFGRPGHGPGRLAYPYDVKVLRDGTLLVCEFGNNRVQRFTPEGRSLGVAGRAGAGDGELQYPWGVDGTPGRIFVLDSGNHRVQVIEEL